MAILQTAARVDEVLRLRWTDVDFERRVLTRWTRKRKGGAYEPIRTPMNKDLYNVLIKQWENRIQNEWVFFNKKDGDRFYHRPKIMKSLCKKAEISPAFGFHALRHFMVSYLANEGKISKMTISGILGHKSLQTTEIYLHSIDDAKISAVRAIEGKFKLDYQRMDPKRVTVSVAGKK